MKTILVRYVCKVVHGILTILIELLFIYKYFYGKILNNKIIIGCLVFPKKNLHVRQISNSINNHFPYNSIFTPHDEDAQYIIVNIYCMIWYDYFLYYFLHNLHTAVDNCSIKFYLLIFYTKHGNNQIFQASCTNSEF